MSLLSRDRLRIGLASNYLAVVGSRRGVWRRRAPKKIIPVKPAPGAAPWQAAVDALPSALALAKRSRPEVTVVLSSHFVRYALLPWNAALKSESEWLALARHRFVSVHGAAAEGWTLRLSETTRRGPLIACAADSALIEGVGARIAGAGARLVSVQPYLMAAFNQIRRLIGAGSCWLVIEEPALLALALIRRGTWQAIRSRRKDDGWRQRLPEILDRESALLGLDEPCTRVVVYAHVPFESGSNGAYELRDETLAPGAAPGDRAFAIALA